MKSHFGKVDYLQLLVILVVFITAIGVYITTPGDTFALSKTADGTPTDMVAKGFALFLFPIIILLFYIVFLTVPYISHHEDLHDFYEHYSGFRFSVTLFLAIVYYAFLLQNFGVLFNLNYVVIPAFAALFYYFGHLVCVSKPNHYIGFRTKWTLKNNLVWKKTHDFAGFMIKSFAIISLVTLLFPSLFMLIFVIGILVLVLVTVFYSKRTYHDIRKKILRAAHAIERDHVALQKPKTTIIVEEIKPKVVSKKKASTTKAKKKTTSTKKTTKKVVPKKKAATKKASTKTRSSRAASAQKSKISRENTSKSTSKATKKTSSKKVAKKSTKKVTKKKSTTKKKK